MKDKTTPRPWKEYPAPYSNRIEADGSSVASVRLPEDTELIVRAVNAHDALVEALDSAPIPRLGETLEQFCVRYSAWYREARKPALDKAKGKT